MDKFKNCKQHRSHHSITPPSQNAHRKPPIRD